MRLFFAITFPEHVKKKIYRNINFLKSSIIKGVKWVEQENLHVTFKFLGDVSPDKLEELFQSTKSVTDRFPPFSVEFGRIKVIPNFHRPRIIWQEMFDRQKIARNIFKQLDNELAKIYFKKSKRPLKLHSTLGRIKFPIHVNWEKILAKTGAIPETVSCEKLTLFKSKLNRKGPIYTIEKTFPFSPNFTNNSN